jgi:hypothetical protein
MAAVCVKLPLNEFCSCADFRNNPNPIMNPASHLVRLQPSPQHRDSESVHLVMRTDIQWGTPVFRAPALPTAHQFSSELPFTVNFRAKSRGRS